MALCDGFQTLIVSSPSVKKNVLEFVKKRITLARPADLFPQVSGLVIKELIQGDKVGDYVVQQVFLVAASFQVSHAGLPNWGSDGGREVPH
jgi:hypothetical protein